jgi:nucleoid-associated protein YgaU
MQQIERYGVLALLLLVVTLVTVGLWGPDPDQARAAERDTETAAADEERSDARQRRRIGDDPQEESRLLLNDGRGRDRATSRLDQRNEEQRAEGGRRLQQPRDREPITREEAPEPVRQDTRRNTTTRNANTRGADTRTARETQRRDEPVDIVPLTRDDQRERRTARRDEVPPPSGEVYVVESGDSLERIARRRLDDGGRWREIAQLNGIEDPDRIRVGQKLLLPGDARREDRIVSAPSRDRVVANEGGTWVYTVRSGDVLSRIASNQLGTKDRMNEILALNPGLVADRIQVGQELLMPPVRTAVVQADGPRRRGADFLGVDRGRAPRGVN